MGSLVCALASYLDARKHAGRWYVRIEDIDPPREQQGAAASILSALHAHQLHWDGSVLYQSQRSHAYTAALCTLTDNGFTYRCSCNRQRIKTLGGRYDKHCLQHPPESGAACAIRFNIEAALQALSETSQWQFEDGIRGLQQQSLQHSGDFIIHRKDGLFAYQLAVVVDDIFQQITHVVRGADLLDMTAEQSLLFHTLGQSPPHYSHHTLVTDANGNKLSKQNGAAAIDSANATKNLLLACHLLGLPLDNETDKNLLLCPPDDVLRWALSCWHPRRQQQPQVVLPSGNHPYTVQSPSSRS